MIKGCSENAHGLQLKYYVTGYSLNLKKFLSISVNLMNMLQQPVMKEGRLAY